MSATLKPVPFLPEEIKRHVKDEHRTIFLSEEASGIARSQIVAVKAQHGSPDTLALVQVVDSGVLQSLEQLHGEFLRMPSFVSTENLNSSTAYSSPCLLSNARAHPVAFPRGLATVINADCQFSSADDVPSASEVHIQFCGGAQVNDGTDAALKAYFHRPRFLSVGWVFAIPAVADNESLFGSQHVPRRLTYFRVAAISPVPESDVHLYQASAADTALVLDAGRANFPIPSLLEACSCETVKHVVPGGYGANAWCPCVPPGLGVQMEILQNAIMPAFSSACLPRNIRPRCHLLLTGDPGSGKKSLVRSCCRWLGVTLCEVSCYDLLADTVQAGETKLKNVFEKARKRCPSVLYLCHAEVLARRKDSAEEELRLGATFQAQLDSLATLSESVVVICSCTKASRLATSVAQQLRITISIPPLSTEERVSVMRDMIGNSRIEDESQLQRIAEKIQGAVLSDVCTLASRALQCSRARLFSGCTPLDDPTSACLPNHLPPITADDWHAALKQFEQSRSKDLGAPKVPEVHWEDVGGLSDVRQEILDTIQLPLEHPELFAGGLKRSGILLYGPPGCGKTLLAKAVATECALNFLSVKGPELLNMYVGQSEENVREVFAKARSAAPCVIFFDELDALAPNRGRSGDSGGVSDRIVSQLLTELDGVGGENNVFVIGATNRPDLIEPALLRPGRFDCRVYVGVYTERRSQLSVLAALTRKFQLAHDVDLRAIVETLPASVSGADISSVCSDAMMSAAHRLIGLIEAEGQSGQSSERLVVCQEDFLHASGQLISSVSAEDVALYEMMKARN